MPRVYDFRRSSVHLVEVAVLTCVAAIAFVGARDFAGGWNDGSRLATVEALVDQHTFAIDESIFVTPKGWAGPGSPYGANAGALAERGTGDKLFIAGHYYSDKSPVPAILLAGWYKLLQVVTGLQANACPDQFCYWMTIAASGLPYIGAVWCVGRVAATVGLGMGLRALLMASFGFATVALPYSRHVNNHEALLGLAALASLHLAILSGKAADGAPRARVLGIGTILGLAYTVDLGAGPLLLVCGVAAIVFVCQSASMGFLAAAGAMPWLVLHHAVNFAIAGTFGPANANPEFFQWPGCSFTPANMTGTFHQSLGHFCVYAAALLLGKRGFIGHSLPLFLLPWGIALACKRLLQWPAAAALMAWSAGTWLVYALTSTNYSGLCCSIRWFVPLLAPAYYVIALLLRENGRFVRPFAVLSAAGALLAGLMWREGPWMPHMVPWFWPIQACALSVAGISWRFGRQFSEFNRQAGVETKAAAA